MNRNSITSVLWGALILCLLTVSPLAGNAASTAEEVVNNIGAATENAVDYVDDGIVTAQVKGRFLGVEGLDSLDISVTTNEGVVTLQGGVDNQAQITLAEDVAKRVRGVKKVVNKLELKN